MATYRGTCGGCGMEVEASLTSPQGGFGSNLISPPGFVYYHHCAAPARPVMMTYVTTEEKTAADLVVGDQVRLGRRLFTVREHAETFVITQPAEGCVVLLLEDEDGSKITPFELSSDAPAVMYDGAWTL